MFLSFLSWWYGQGWRGLLDRISDRIVRLNDMFSLGMLVRTLFAPFRQIGVGEVRGSIDMKFQAWADRMVSRCVGAVVRTCTLLAGVVAILCVAAIGAVQLVGWLLLPLAPLFGLILSLAGWIPWQI